MIIRGKRFFGFFYFSIHIFLRLDINDLIEEPEPEVAEEPVAKPAATGDEEEDVGGDDMAGNINKWFNQYVIVKHTTYTVSYIKIFLLNILCEQRDKVQILQGLLQETLIYIRQQFYL